MPLRPGFSTLTYQEGLNVYKIIKNKLSCKSYVAGSIRRKNEYINDIDIVIITSKNIDLSFIFTKVIRMGNSIISGVFIYKNKKVMIDIFITTREELPFAMLQYTGPKSYNIRIRHYVKKTYGWLLNQYGIFYQNNPSKRVIGSSKIKTEKQLIEFIGTTYYPPELRK